MMTLALCLILTGCVGFVTLELRKISDAISDLARVIREKRP